MNYNHLLLPLILGLSLLVNNGCPAPVIFIGAGAAAGAGTVAYIGGELKSTEEVSLNRAWDATQKVMDDLEFDITSKKKDAFDSKLTAQSAADEIITIKLKKQSDTETEIRIRVGTFGNEYLSRQILEKIKRQF